MRFYINPGDGIISVDGYQIQPVTVSGLASNISYVQWDETSLGLIVYKDQAPTFQSFSDPSPYQSNINAWMSSAAGLALTLAQQAMVSTPLLAVAQAQMVKIDLTNAIYDFKRQSAIQFAVSSGDAGYNAGVVAASPGGVYNWDCSDESLNAMTMAMSSAILSGTSSAVNTSLVNAINTALSTVTTRANGSLTALLSNVNSAFVAFTNVLNSAMQLIFGTVTAAFPYLISSIDNALATSSTTLASNADIGPSGWSIGPGNAGSTGTNFTAPTLIGSPWSLVSSVQWIPIGQTSPVTLSGTEFSSLVAAVVARRASLNQAKQTALASIAATSSVAQVIAFDATAGWPF